MTFNIGILVLLMFLSLIVAEDSVNNAGISVTPEVFVITAIILACIFIAFGTMSFVYFTFLKRKMVEPQYYIDDTPNNKNDSEFNNGNNDIYPQLTHINQIQPILTVSHIVSSIRQSLLDLGDSLIPFAWSHAQCVYNQQNPFNEKMDLPI